MQHFISLKQTLSFRAIARNLILFVACLTYSTSFSQESLDNILNKFNTKSIPYISVQELAMPKTKAIILDAREKKEHDISHIKNSIFVGYDNFKIETVKDAIPDKSQQIVVYCTLGIRSEDIAEKLKKEGYTNVLNLYGGIVEWKNKGFDVFDSKEQKTENVHVFNADWSQWLKNGNKVY